MYTLRAHTRLTGWIAALAIVLASLAPSLSHALGTAQGSFWSEICTSQSSKWSEEGANDTPSVPTGNHTVEHCSFCSIHSPAVGLPSSFEIALLPIAKRSELLPAIDADPGTLRAWTRAPSRAPPVR